MIYDHENGNWKNSEIARNFLEALEKTAGTPIPTDLEEDESDLLPDDSAAVAECHEELNTHYRHTAAQLIINELNKIASAGESSSAALELELAVEDLKDIFK